MKIKLLGWVLTLKRVQEELTKAKTLSVYFDLPRLDSTWVLYKDDPYSMTVKVTRYSKDLETIFYTVIYCDGVAVKGSEVSATTKKFLKIYSKY